MALVAWAQRVIMGRRPSESGTARPQMPVAEGVKAKRKRSKKRERSKQKRKDCACAWSKAPRSTRASPSR